jgi:methylphosphotriester-DNA--protein-cysteine methyltransferase
MRKSFLKHPLFFSALVFILVLIPLSIRAQNYNYVASKFSNKYHRPTCKWALKIQPQNRVTFNTVKQAVEAGHNVPCKTCKPPAKD